MPRLSKTKKEKIQEQIIFHLYEAFPRQLFTSDIAKEVARDEEFIKVIMQEMEKKNLVVKIDKNPAGIAYLKRLRWRISNNVYDIYKKKTDFNKNAQITPLNSEIPPQNQEETVKKDETPAESIIKPAGLSYIC